MAEAKETFAKLTTHGSYAFADEDGDSKLGRAELQTVRKKFLKMVTEDPHNAYKNNDLATMSSWLHIYQDPEPGTSAALDPLYASGQKMFENQFAFADANGDAKLDATELAA